MDTLTIGQAAAHLGISTHALRYYERAGLIAPVARSPSGHRRYSVEDLEHLRFLHCLRQTQMPIRRIREFAAVARVRDADAALAILSAHRCDVERRIAELQDRLRVIDRKIARLQGRDPDGE
jgi:DNA-binding transcriptional MerR regulator